MLDAPRLKRTFQHGLIRRSIYVIRILAWHPIQPRCHTALVTELFRHLLDEMVKAPLASA
jgi:hypothetical protein